MLNFYPWGLSLNWVEPIAPAQTRIHFFTYVYDEGRYTSEIEASIHTTEMEDEAVVHQVQRGIRSSAYQSGRYSPEMEVALHHFHRLITRQLQTE